MKKGEILNIENNVTYILPSLQNSFVKPSEKSEKTTPTVSTNCRALLKIKNIKYNEELGHAHTDSKYSK